MTTNDADHVSAANAHLIAHAADIARRITGDRVRAARQAPEEPPPHVLHRSIGLWQPPPATWEEA